MLNAPAPHDGAEEGSGGARDGYLWGWSVCPPAFWFKSFYFRSSLGIIDWDNGKICKFEARAVLQRCVHGCP